MYNHIKQPPLYFSLTLFAYYILPRRGDHQSNETALYLELTVRTKRTKQNVVKWVEGKLISRYVHRVVLDRLDCW
jgi:hypothetical protein